MASLTRTALNQLVVDNLSSGTSITATEHRTVEYGIIDSCKPYNSGYFIVGDIGAIVSPTTIPSYGLLSATISSPTGFTNMSKIVVVFNTATPMPNANYYVRMFVKSTATPASNLDFFPPYFTNTTTTGFDVYIREQSSGAAQSITIYFEAIPID
jgi:hypothetical protein